MEPPSRNRYCLRNQVCLITGASSGIGEACAWRFAEEGCKLVLIARRVERLQLLAEAIMKHYKVATHIVEMDVRDTDRVTALPSELPDEFKQVDILINNAGLALGTESIDKINIDDAHTMIDTNITQVLVFTRTFSPGMVERNKGHIINISSIAGLEYYSGGAVYCATKFAVEAMTGATRHDLAGTLVRVTSLCPGAVKTEFSIVRFNGDESKADAVYEGIEALTAGDIAEDAAYAATRPQHVQVCQVVTLATFQCSAKGLARVLK